ncbi:AraC family transcriptional regulator ligand-binding domain-containing protein [Pseudomonas sp. N40(2020)]|uniref:AraC family transcriptional regulator ligand-binding domain-containing protein n=1 Tax=Pseudomonas sp. N40(2020) TaxID=2767798 RepID=UPI001656E148|nr:AraC family transcriptional regulator ligand-binding domain-containing protein [Pseudomonas sp. N40(2020)]MBC8995400.1 AraC family transcriptional regulator ligand-binding domain-containing protein [Pseudomonas sp. N40(2020)]
MPQTMFASSAFTRTILGHAEQAGLCPQTLLARADISRAALADQDEQIPAHRVEQLWRECEQAGVAATFGCELVNAMSTTCLQGLNILLDSAATLRASLDCFVMFVPRVNNYVAVELQEAGDFVQLRLRPVQGRVHHFGLDAATLALVRNIARRLGKAPDAVFVGVGICPPQAAGHWLRQAGIRVEEGEYPCLTLHRSCLDETLLGANPFLHQSMLRHWLSESSAPSRNDSLEMARHWLTAGDQPIERIAERLGYRQPSNFIRAFRKQFGITPKQFRLNPL